MSVNCSEKILFVSDKQYLQAEISGGVQICTQDFLNIFHEAGMEVIPFSISPINNLLVRSKVFVGIDAYDQYVVKAILPKLQTIIEATNPRTIVLNMSNLAKFAKPLKRLYGVNRRIVLISHGNESGDFLYPATRSNSLAPLSLLNYLRKAYRLGAQLIHEAKCREFIDHVFCISNVELEIEHWLGAKNVDFIPRLIVPNFLDWDPVVNRIGYVGTLNHLPNAAGVLTLLDALDRNDPFCKVKVRLVGKVSSEMRTKLLSFKRVEYLGVLNDEQMREEAKSWSIFVQPIFWYSRGASMKLMKGIEWGIPIVTTVPGMRGYEWQKGSLCIVSDATEMAQKILSSLASKDALQYLAKEVRKVAISGPSKDQMIRCIHSGLTGSGK